MLLKMKNTSFFQSNEPYNISRGQKLMKVQNFKVDTAKNKLFWKSFDGCEKKNTPLLSKIGYLGTLTCSSVIRNDSNAL